MSEVEDWIGIAEIGARSRIMKEEFDKSKETAIIKNRLFSQWLNKIDVKELENHMDERSPAISNASEEAKEPQQERPDKVKVDVVKSVKDRPNPNCYSYNVTPESMQPDEFVTSIQNYFAKTFSQPYNETPNKPERATNGVMQLPKDYALKFFLNTKEDQKR